MGLVTNYGQLLALRVLLGLFESGLFPGLNFFLTGWYRREEINKRCSIFFAGAVMAGAFGGIFGCKCLSTFCACRSLTPSRRAEPDEWQGR